MATLRQLKTFIAVAEYKKMSEAAKHLYISQPTVSQIIAELEKDYNTQLFERIGKELRITAAGNLLLKSALEILAIHDNLEQNMKNINSIRPFRIGVTMTIGNNMIADIIQKVETRYPDIECYVYVDNTRHIESMLAQNELDIALVEGNITHQEILKTPIYEDDLCLICSSKHRFAKKRTNITIDALKEEKFILREKGSGTRAIFETIMKNQRLPLRIKWEAGSSKAIIEAVSRNLGLGFISKKCINEKVDRGELVECPIPEFTIKRYFYLCYNSNQPITSQMRDFLNILYAQPGALIRLENL